jgi:hypothetical protein
MKRLLFLLLMTPLFMKAQPSGTWVSSKEKCMTIKHHVTGKIMKVGAFGLSKKSGKYEPGLSLVRIEDAFSISFSVRIKDYDKDVNLDDIYLIISYTDGRRIKLSSSLLTTAQFEGKDLSVRFTCDKANDAIAAFKQSVVTKMELDLTNSGIADYTVEIAEPIVKQINKTIACISEP